ncbi:MAG: hypothetical protein FGM33_01310 [Candidatus Kapabacteria bacterium]|nr:hypothetical protein [Candidatus Kapabacteria bacterium]
MTVRMLLTTLWVLTSAIAWAQYEILPAELPHRPDPVLRGMLKIRLSAEYAARAPEILAELGLRVVRPVLPYGQSLAYRERSVLGSTRQRPMDMNEAQVVEERLLRSFVVSYDRPDIPPEQIIARLRVGCGPIECAAPWCVMELCGEPNDPERVRQDLLKTIQAYAAWDVEPGSDSVIIGISDSGVRMDHEDLVDALHARVGEIPGNGVDDDDNGYIDDHRGYNFSWKEDSTQPGDVFNPANGHGTSVAGTCAATANNGKGIAGVGGKCRMFPLRTMPKGTTGIVFGYESIMYAAVNGFDVVNCSWGGQSPSCIDQDVVSYAIARGTAVVAAAGNHYAASPFYPASYRGVLGVGVVDASDNVIAMTGRGPTVDVMAPGHSSWSTSNDGSYSTFCCTSGSAPIASALVALVRSRYRSIGPLQACAMVRDAVDEAPWRDVPAEIDALQLPRGRVNALKAVTAHPDTLVSVEIDTIELAARSGSQRWTVGDTLRARVGLVNRLGPWTLKIIGTDGVTGAGRTALKSTSDAGSITQQAIATGERFFLPEQDFVVVAETDTAAYVHMRLLGTDASGAAINRRYSYAVTPAPAYTTLSNRDVRISIGDRGRIGNTDIDRGQGEGLRFRDFCGQLYEGGLMIHANGRTVDAIRSGRRSNDHFRPIRRFTGAHAISGTFSDADAPDSLRIGVEVELAVDLDSLNDVMRLDLTITNRSDTTLHDLAVAWFYDWDLGRQPARNVTQKDRLFQYVSSVGPAQPMVALYNQSVFSDATPLLAGIDNTTTYGGFPTDRKTAILREPDSFNYTDTNDVATATGMRFRMPVPAGHRRSFRQVIVIDTSRNGLADKLERETWVWGRPPTDTLFTADSDPVFPNPASSIVYVPVDASTGSPITFSVFDVSGRQVHVDVLRMIPPNQYVHPLDVGSLSSGTYSIRAVAPDWTHTWPLLIVR